MFKRSRATSVTVLLVLAAAFQAAAQIPLGPEFRVDTSGSATHFFSASGRSSAIAPNGQFVVAWFKHNSGDDYDVVARLFDRSGRAKGPEILVNTYTTGLQFNEAVGMDDTGNFVVVWTGEHQNGNGTGVFGQRFDRSGRRLGAEFRVSDSSTAQLQPSLAVTSSGDLVVVWISPDGDSWGIFGQRFDASGSPSGAEFQVNTTTTGQQYVPTVDVDGQGNFVVVWASVDINGPMPVRAYGQRFTASGSPQGGEFAISSYTTDIQARTRVASARDGSFVVAWWGSFPGDSNGISARRFDADGLPIGSSFQVNEFSTGSQNWPEVDVDADGDFVITWMGPEQDGSSYGVFARRFESTGAASAEFRVNTYTSGLQWYPTTATDPTGNFIVAWLSQRNVDMGIFAQRYAIDLPDAGPAVGHRPWP